MAAAKCKAKKIIPFAKVLQEFSGVAGPRVGPAYSDKELTEAITDERIRLVAGAPRDAYVAVPTHSHCGMFSTLALQWIILRPLPDGAPDTSDAVVNYPLDYYKTFGGRRQLELRSPHADNLLLDREASEDLAAALTLGRAARCLK